MIIGKEELAHPVYLTRELEMNLRQAWMLDTYKRGRGFPQGARRN
jgi:hypothetical protein